MTLVDFDTPDLARQVEALKQDQVNRLDFGAIRLNAAGVVVFFSESERRLSGYRHDAMNRDFFTDIAPCMNNPGFKGRIDRALAGGTLDIEFDHIGDFDDDTKELRVRAQSAPDGGCWIFMRREG